MLSEEKMNDGLNNSISRSRILLVDDDVDITTSLKIMEYTQLVGEYDLPHCYDAYGLR
jgi:hypothetical protein